MRYKLVDANGVVHAYSRTKAKIIRYLNETYKTKKENENTLPCQFQILKVSAEDS